MNTQPIRDLRSPRTARSEFRSHAKNAHSARIVRQATVTRGIPETHEFPWIAAMFVIAALVFAGRVWGLV